VERTRYSWSAGDPVPGKVRWYAPLPMSLLLSQGGELINVIQYNIKNIYLILYRCVPRVCVELQFRLRTEAEAFGGLG